MKGYILTMLLLLLGSNISDALFAQKPSHDQENKNEKWLSSNNEVLRSFSDFEKDESERERFIKEMYSIDSILQFENYIELLGSGDLETLIISIEIIDTIVHIDFKQMFCSDYTKLRNNSLVNNIEKLKWSNLLQMPCRGIASEIDILPARTGSIAEDCKLYLDAIKKMIDQNKAKLTGFTFKHYQKLEIDKLLVSDAQYFDFRSSFIKFLFEKYYITIN